MFAAYIKFKKSQAGREQNKGTLYGAKSCSEIVLGKERRGNLYVLKGHGQDFSQILFFCFNYLQCFRNAFLLIK